MYDCQHVVNLAMAQRHANFGIETSIFDSFLVSHQSLPPALGERPKARSDSQLNLTQRNAGLGTL
jgi:hypothetical protein